MVWPEKPIPLKRRTALLSGTSQHPHHHPCTLEVSIESVRRTRGLYDLLTNGTEAKGKIHRPRKDFKVPEASRLV